MFVECVLHEVYFGCEISGYIQICGSQFLTFHSFREQEDDNEHFFPMDYNCNTLLHIRNDIREGGSFVTLYIERPVSYKYFLDKFSF
mmetsp:Transcript_5679/g.6456  ORF Transcript_5679/g.6456 Transcript_5679/m.6456 type:complete len:87 (-) Transcript_5679:362-622(-)